MHSDFFLDPDRADEDGLVGVGGDLTPQRLLDAYSRGIFPFYDDASPILWWSPDPRTVLELDGLHVSRRSRARFGRVSFRSRSTVISPVSSRAARTGPAKDNGSFLR